jgi:hypothetical protein
MTPKQAATELKMLLDELRRRGGSAPSPELNSFLESLGRRNVRKTRLSEATEPSREKVAKRRVRDPDAMAKTIKELAAKLRASFMSDLQFEAAVTEAAECKLTRDNVVQLYNELFETDRKFSKSASKPDVFNAIRRDRIARVRARS